MLEFLNPKIHGFGIDLSDLSIKIIDLKKGDDNFCLASFGRQEIPAGLIEEGEIKKEEELIEVIKKAAREVQGRPLKNKYCVVSLPETESYVRMVQLPAMKKEEAAEAIKWEIEANIPLAREEIYYDWQIIEPTGNGVSAKTPECLNVLIGVLPKKTVDPYLDVLKKANLKPYVFEIESVAASRALIKKNQTNESLIVIDLGAKRTTLVILTDQTICFTTGLNISNNYLIDILSKNLKISQSQARQIKMKVGLDLKHPQSRIFQELKAPLSEMTDKIKDYIDFYHEHMLDGRPSGDKISQILLCGGGANLAGLPEFLSAELKMKVSLGNPWTNILEDSGETPPLPPEDSLGYTTALGLALRGL